MGNLKKKMLGNLDELACHPGEVEIFLATSRHVLQSALDLNKLPAEDFSSLLIAYSMTNVHNRCLKIHSFYPMYSRNCTRYDWLVETFYPVAIQCT